MIKSRIVAEPEEGAEIVRQLKVYDNIHVSDSEFGELEFKLDVSEFTIREVNELFEDFKEIHEDFNLFIDTDRTVNFDYYISKPILIEVRALVDKLTGTYYRGKLLKWHYWGAKGKCKRELM